jgi:hypothetical protein
METTVIRVVTAVAGDRTTDRKRHEDIRKELVMTDISTVIANEKEMARTFGKDQYTRVYPKASGLSR